MSDIRDPELGRALALLTVPDHGDRFWSDLAARLTDEGAPAVTEPTTTVRRPHVARFGEGGPGIGATVTDLPVAEDRRGRRPRQDRRRWLATAAVAAVVALVTAAALLSERAQPAPTPPVATTPEVPAGPEATPGEDQAPTPGPAPTLSPAPSNPAPSAPDEPSVDPGDEPGATSTTAPASLIADVTLTTELAERRLTLVADRDGSRHAFDAETGERVAVDVADADSVAVYPDGEGATSSVRRRGLPAGGPDLIITLPTDSPALVAHTLALARSGDPSVVAAEALGRPAWRLETDVVPNAFAGPGSPDAAVVVVDRATSLLLLLEERSGDELVRRIEVTSLETSDEPAGRDAFEVDGDTDEVIDEGFERTTLDELRGTEQASSALVPTAVPDGFTLATVDVRPGRAPGGGPEGMNPESVDTVVLTYRRGWDELVVTTRRTLAEPGRWEDPYRGEGQVLEPEVVVVDGGALDGTEAEVTLAPTTVPNLWGVTPERVVTVAGPVSGTTLLEVASSLAPLG